MGGEEGEEGCGDEEVEGKEYGGEAKGPQTTGCNLFVV